MRRSFGLISAYIAQICVENVFTEPLPKPTKPGSGTSGRGGKMTSYAKKYAYDLDQGNIIHVEREDFIAMITEINTLREALKKALED